MSKPECVASPIIIRCALVRLTNGHGGSASPKPASHSRTHDFAGLLGLDASIGNAHRQLRKASLSE